MRRRAVPRGILSGLLAACLLAPPGAGPARAEEPVSVAVLDFDTQGAPAGDAAILSEYVRQAFVARGDFTIVDRKNMSKTLQEQAVQQTGCTSSDCAVKLGKVLNVRKIVVGTYGLLEGGFRVMTAQLVDVETSRIERSAKVKGFQVSNADEAAEALVKDLIEGARTPRTFESLPPPGAAGSSPGDVGRGMVDGETDAKANTGGPAWFLAGACPWPFPGVGVIFAYVKTPSPPPSRLIGKSPEYVAAYTSTYESTGKSRQGKIASIGCLVTVVVFGVIILLVSAAASGSAASTSASY